MSQHSSLRRATLCASLCLATFLTAGCSDDGIVTVNPNATALARGNWQISAASASSAPLSSFSGAFAAQDGKITALVHAQSTSACLTQDTPISLTGAEDKDSNVTLSGALAGGTLTVTGTLAADGRSLTNAAYSVKGGSCAGSKAAATVQNYAAVNGNYAGNFADTAGQVAQVTANFSQSTTPDASGNFTLAGTASVSNNPCFPTSLPVANTQVTGGTFTFTYGTADNSVTASGTFSPDANTLTVTSWTLTGTCGLDTGVQSTMTRQ